MTRKCPECGSRDGIVVQTRETKRDVLWRRRRCRSCDARWTTWEVAMSPTLLATLNNAIDKIARAAEGQK